MPIHKNPPKVTVAHVREAVNRLVKRGHLADPQAAHIDQPQLVLDIDDHVSDETIAGGRVRVVLRSLRELHELARALEEVQLIPHNLEGDDVP